MARTHAVNMARTHASLNDLLQFIFGKYSIFFSYNEEQQNGGRNL
jgi:hypothetical protein